MANSDDRAPGRRGEVWVGEDGPRLFFSNMALAQAEKRMGRSVLDVLRSLSEGKAGIGEIGEILAAGMEGARRDDGGRGRPVMVRQAFVVMDRYDYATVVEAISLGVGTVIAPDEDDGDADDPGDGEDDDYPN